MAFKIGLVGLCTSHPENWVPIIRKLTEEKLIEAEIVAAWDSGETRPEGFAEDFCRRLDIPNAVEKLEDMVGLVDGVIVHTTNWDQHVNQSRPFVEADKPVLIDKPVVGRVSDANQLLDWSKLGKRMTGGSSLRFAAEVREFLAKPVEDRGELHTAFAGCGTDEFNYGIHAYSLLSGLMGPGIRSVRYLGANKQKHIKITWQDGKVGFLAVGKLVWLPFHITAVTTKTVGQITPDTSAIYRSLLEVCMPYLTGKVDQPPLPMDVLLEPELAAIAARTSWLRGGAEVFLTDLGPDDPGYDGRQFAIEYRRARLEG